MTWSGKERLWALLFVFGLSACTDDSLPEEPLRFAGSTMGTQYSVLAFAPQSDSVALEIGIQRTLNRIVDRMSVYEPASDVTTFNEAPVGTWVPVAPEVVRVVDAARTVAGQSDGLFDPTVYPLVQAWGFGPRGRPEEIPEEATLRDLLRRVDWRAVETRQEPAALRKQAPVALDLSAIAKGYGADAVAEYLKTQGVAHFLVELGGDMVMAGGKPDGSSWRVAIEEPVENQRRVYRVIELNSGALVTSGDYRNYYEQGGSRWTHVIDPRDGRPIRHDLASVSVLGESAMMADAWATALLVAGQDQALRLANEQSLSVLLIRRQANGFTEASTGRFDRLVEGDEK